MGAAGRGGNGICGRAFGGDGQGEVGGDEEGPVGGVGGSGDGVGGETVVDGGAEGGGGDVGGVGGGGEGGERGGDGDEGGGLPGAAVDAPVEGGGSGVPGAVGGDGGVDAVGGGGGGLVLEGRVVEGGRGVDGASEVEGIGLGAVGDVPGGDDGGPASGGDVGRGEVDAFDVVESVGGAVGDVYRAVGGDEAEVEVVDERGGGAGQGRGVAPGEGGGEGGAGGGHVEGVRGFVAGGEGVRAFVQDRDGAAAGEDRGGDVDPAVAFGGGRPGWDFGGVAATVLSGRERAGAAGQRRLEEGRGRRRDAVAQARPLPDLRRRARREGGRHAGAAEVEVVGGAGYDAPSGRGGGAGAQGGDVGAGRRDVGLRAAVVGGAARGEGGEAGRGAVGGRGDEVGEDGLGHEAGRPALAVGFRGAAAAAGRASALRRRHREHVLRRGRGGEGARVDAPVAVVVAAVVAPGRDEEQVGMRPDVFVGLLGAEVVGAGGVGAPAVVVDAGAEEVGFVEERREVVRDVQHALRVRHRLHDEAGPGGDAPVETVGGRARARDAARHVRAVARTVAPVAVAGPVADREQLPGEVGMDGRRVAAVESRVRHGDDFAGAVESQRLGFLRRHVRGRAGEVGAEVFQGGFLRPGYDGRRCRHLDRQAQRQACRHQTVAGAGGYGFRFRRARGQQPTCQVRRILRHERLEQHLRHALRFRRGRFAQARGDAAVRSVVGDVGDTLQRPHRREGRIRNLR